MTCSNNDKPLPPTAADIALGLIYNDRRKDYNEPSEEFQKIAEVWGAILGQPVTKYQYCLCMIAVKLIREAGKHKRDNLVDMLGYAQLLDDLEGRI